MTVTDSTPFFRGLFDFSISGLLSALHKLDEHQIAFVSITENLDFSTPWGKLILAVLGALAEIYIDKLREETKKGKLARARKGLWNGSIPFGYCNGLCASCSDVNGKDYCPKFGQANRSHGGILIPHPIESVGVQLTFRWYETTPRSHRIIAKSSMRMDSFCQMGPRITFARNVVMA